MRKQLLNQERVALVVRWRVARVQQTGAHGVSEQLLFIVPVAPSFFGTRAFAAALVHHDVGKLAQIVNVLNRIDRRTFCHAALKQKPLAKEGRGVLAGLKQMALARAAARAKCLPT